MMDYDDCCFGGYMEISMSSSPQRQGPFEFRDQGALEARRDRFLAENPDQAYKHQGQYEGKGLIIFPGEYPSLPGVY